MKDQCVEKNKKLALLFSFIGLSSLQSSFTGTCLCFCFVFFIKRNSFLLSYKDFMVLMFMACLSAATWAADVNDGDKSYCTWGNHNVIIYSPQLKKKKIFSPWIAFSSVCKTYWSCLSSSLQTVIQDNKLFTTKEISLNNLIHFSQLQKSTGRKWWAFAIYQQVGYFQAVVQVVLLATQTSHWDVSNYWLAS